MSKKYECPQCFTILNHPLEAKVEGFRKWVWDMHPIFHLNNEMYCDGFSDGIVQMQLKITEIFGDKE